MGSGLSLATAEAAALHPGLAVNALATAGLYSAPAGGSAGCGFEELGSITGSALAARELPSLVEKGAHGPSWLGRSRERTRKSASLG